MLRKGTIFFGIMIMVFSFYMAMPFVAAAQTNSGLVPCGTETNKDGTVANPCGWNDLVKLVGNVANYLIILGAAFSAVAFGWAGLLMMTAGGEMSKIEHAKSIFGKVVIGFIIMLSAWLIVRAIELGFEDKSVINSLLS